MKSIFILILAILDVVFSVCPPPSLLSPCTCQDDKIHCSISELDLSAVFESIRNDRTHTQRHYIYIYISNQFITEIKDNSFKDFTFDTTYIQYCQNLTRIYLDAFNETNCLTSNLLIRDNYKLT